MVCLMLTAIRFASEGTKILTISFSIVMFKHFAESTFQIRTVTDKDAGKTNNFLIEQTSVYLTIA